MEARERVRAQSNPSVSMESSHSPSLRHASASSSSPISSTVTPVQPERNAATPTGPMAPASPTRPSCDPIGRRPQGLSDQSRSQVYVDRRTLALMWLYAFVFVAMLGFACFNPNFQRPGDIGVLRGYSPQHQAIRSDQSEVPTAALEEVDAVSQPIPALPTIKRRQYTRPSPYPEFRPHLIRIIPYLCIEPLPVGTAPREFVMRNAQGQTLTSLIDKRLVAYHTPEGDRGVLSLNPGQSGNAGPHAWVIDRVEGPPPEGHIMSNRTAYFVTTTCAAHIYHLLDDTLIPLYHTMQAMNEFSKPQDPDLEPSAALLYQIDLAGIEGFEANCHGLARRSYMEALPVGDDHSAWWRWGEQQADGSTAQQPTAVHCFRDAVLGLSMDPPNEVFKAFRDHVLRQVGIDPDMDKEGQCDPAIGNQLLIVQRRKTRRVLNLDELVAAAEVAHNGKAFDSTRVLYLEDMPDIGEQLRVFYCADMAYMVHGAAVSYSLFMRPGTTLMQSAIGAFPTPAMPGYYRHFGDVAGVTMEGVRDDDVHVNTNHSYVASPGDHTVIADAGQVLRLGQGGNEWVLRFMDLRVDVPRFAAQVENHVLRREAAKEAVREETAREREEAAREEAAREEAAREEAAREAAQEQGVQEQRS